MVLEKAYGFVGVVVSLKDLSSSICLQAFLSLRILQIIVAGTLFALAFYRMFRARHPRGGGMKVGFRDLFLWSFLRATGHGAGLMLAPILLADAGHESFQAQLGLKRCWFRCGSSWTGGWGPHVGLTSGGGHAVPCCLSIL